MVKSKTMVWVLVVLIIGLAAGYGVSGTRTVTTTTTKVNTVTSTVATTVTKTAIKTQTVKEEYNVKLAYNPKFGLYLVDSKGVTLYFFSKDYDGKSHCYGDCAMKWPVFYVEKLNPGPGLDPKDFGVIERNDGKKQITYKGWPLYYFFKDNGPGDINGDGVKNVWYVAKSDYTVMIAVKEDIGKYLVDDRGMTLYFFKKDETDKSNCYGECAMKWPIFSPNKLVLPSTLKLEDFKFIMRGDGSIQLSYKGHPLYYWINDKSRGDTNGHGVKNVWYVAYVSGELGG